VSHPSKMMLIVLAVVSLAVLLYVGIRFSIPTEKLELGTGTTRASRGQTCDSLRTSTSSDLISFLARVSPDNTNADCVQWAVKQLGARRYEPSATTLVKYLDFQRPLTGNEKLGFYLHPLTPDDLYPAVGALIQIGANVLPTVLQTIGANATSPKARQNAVIVLMEIYRSTDEHPKGIALLHHEAINANDDATRERFSWAVSQALTWCNTPEESTCKQAAVAHE
jgi:hypothetical protein